MQPEMLSNELRVFLSVQEELRDAMNRSDRKSAWLAIEELRGMQQHSAWPRLRARCAATIAEYVH